MSKWIVVASLAAVGAALALLPEHRFQIVTLLLTASAVGVAGLLAFHLVRGMFRLTVQPWLTDFRTGDKRIVIDREVDAMQLFDAKDGQPVLVPMGELLVSAKADRRNERTWVSGCPGTVYIGPGGFGTVTAPVDGYWRDRDVLTGTYSVTFRRAGRAEHFRHWAAQTTFDEPGCHVQYWNMDAGRWRDLQRWLRVAGKRCRFDARAHRAQWDARTAAAVAAARLTGGLRRDKALVEHAVFDDTGAIKAYAGIDGTGRAVLIEGGAELFNGPAENLAPGEGHCLVVDGGARSRGAWPAPVLQRVAFLRQRAQLARMQPPKRPLWKRLIGAA